MRYFFRFAKGEFALIYPPFFIVLKKGFYIKNYHNQRAFLFFRHAHPILNGYLIWLVVP